MKTSIILTGFFAVIVSGCASTAAVPIHSADQTEVKSNVPGDKKSDNFDQAGFIFSDGSRWIWNTSVQTWQWIDSPKHEAELKKAGSVVKEMFRGAYNAAQEEMKKQ